MIAALTVFATLLTLGSALSVIGGIGMKDGAVFGAGVSGLAVALVMLGLAKVIELLEQIRDAVRASKKPAAAQPVPPKLPAELPSERPYFVLDGNERQGPFTRADLQRLLASGAINADTYVAKNGDAEWSRVGEVLR